MVSCGWSTVPFDSLIVRLLISFSRAVQENNVILPAADRRYYTLGMTRRFVWLIEVNSYGIEVAGQY